MPFARALELMEYLGANPSIQALFAAFVGFERKDGPGAATEDLPASIGASMGARPRSDLPDYIKNARFNKKRHGR